MIIQLTLKKINTHSNDILKLTPLVSNAFIPATFSFCKIIFRYLYHLIAHRQIRHMHSKPTFFIRRFIGDFYVKNLEIKGRQIKIPGGVDISWLMRYVS